MTMITENGTDQLSQRRQEHHQNRDGVQAHRRRWPAFLQRNAAPRPVEPAGRLSASFSILSIAAPELKPAAFSDLKGGGAERTGFPGRIASGWWRRRRTASCCYRCRERTIAEVRRHRARVAFARI